MRRDSERHKLFNRRAFFLAAGKFALLSTLAGRMYYLQMIEGGRYQTLADENRINLRLLAPPRGRIIDRFGRAMADNQRNYRILLVPEDVKGRDIKTILDLVAKIVPLSKNDRRRVMREIGRNRNFVPITLKENLGWQDMARVEVNTPALPGILGMRGIVLLNLRLRFCILSKSLPSKLFLFFITSTILAVLSLVSASLTLNDSTSFDD